VLCKVKDTLSNTFATQHHSFRSSCCIHRVQWPLPGNRQFQRSTIVNGDDPDIAIRATGIESASVLYYLVSQSVSQSVSRFDVRMPWMQPADLPASFPSTEEIHRALPAYSYRSDLPPLLVLAPFARV